MSKQLLPPTEVIELAALPAGGIGCSKLAH
jgi:hypothetical protein